MKKSHHVPYIVVVALVAVVAIVVLVLNLKGTGEAILIPSNPLPVPSSGQSLCDSSPLWSACGIGGLSFCLVNTSNAQRLTPICVALASEGQRCSIPSQDHRYSLPGVRPGYEYYRDLQYGSQYYGIRGECANGLLCYGESGLSPTCHKICTANSQCADGTCSRYRLPGSLTLLATRIC